MDVDVASGLARQLPLARTVPDFRDLLIAHDLLNPDARFLHVETDSSNQCNLRCRMCYFRLESHHAAHPVYLSPPGFRRLADCLLPYARTLTLSLGSEPLMSPYFVANLAIASRYAVPEVTFFTNGLLLSERIVNAIIGSGVTKVCFGVDGATRQTYERIRRGGRFNRLIANIRMLAAGKRSARLAFPILRFDVVMMRSNIHELEDIMTLAADLGVSEVNLAHLIAYTGLEMESEQLIHDQALSDYWLERALDCARRLGIVVVSHPRPFVPHGAVDAPPREEPEDAFRAVPYCRFPFFHVALNAGGHVEPCPFAHGEAPFGHLLPGVLFEEIWFGPRFNRLRAQILTADPPAMCRRCSHLANRHPNTAELFEPRSVEVAAQQGAQP